MAHRIRHSIIQILKLSFAAGLIIWLVKSGRLEFKDLTQLLQWYYLIPCLFMAGLNLFFGSERWRSLLHAKGLPLSMGEALKLTFIGTFFNYAMPGGVGGDVVKGYYIAKRNSHARLTSLVTIAMDRMTGLYCMILMALGVMLASPKYVNESPELKTILSILIVIFTLYSLGWVVVFSHRVSSLLRVEMWLPKLPFGGKALHLYHDFTSYRHVKSVFFKTVAFSLAAQTTSIFFFVLAGYGLGYDTVPLNVYFFVAPIGFMITAVPISPAGVGVGQAAFYFLFNSALHHQSQLGPTTVTAFQLGTLFYGLIGAVFYLALQRKDKATHNVPREVS